MSQKELLQTRADQIVNGIGKAVEAGLDPDVIDFARFSKQNGTANLTQDMWLTLLGLKPVTSFALNGAAYFRLDGGKHVIDLIEAPEGFTTLFNKNIDCIWNPNQVSKILVNFPDFRVDTYNIEEFRSFVYATTHGRNPRGVYLAGLLHGMPPKAVMDFVKYRAAIEPIVEMVWDEATKMGIEISFPNPSGYYLDSSSEIRDEFARLAEATGIVKKPKNLLNYIRYARASQTPGSPYFTSGQEPGRHEKRLTKLYELSGLEKKLDQITDKYKEVTD